MEVQQVKYDDKIVEVPMNTAGESSAEEQTYESPAGNGTVGCEADAKGARVQDDAGATDDHDDHFSNRLDVYLRAAARAAVLRWGAGHPDRLHVQKEALTRLEEEPRTWDALVRLKVLSQEYGELARCLADNAQAARRALGLAVATRQLAGEIEESIYAASCMTLRSA